MVITSGHSTHLVAEPRRPQCGVNRGVRPSGDLERAPVYPCTDAVCGVGKAFEGRTRMPTVTIPVLPYGTHVKHGARRLAKGAPPLTDNIVYEVGVLVAWVLDTGASFRQASDLRWRLVTHWNAPGERNRALRLRRIKESINSLSPSKDQGRIDDLSQITCDILNERNEDGTQHQVAEWASDLWARRHAVMSEGQEIPPPSRELAGVYLRSRTGRFDH